MATLLALTPRLRWKRAGDALHGSHGAPALPERHVDGVMERRAPHLGQEAAQ